MRIAIALATGALLISSVANAAGLMTSVPSSSMTVTHWYKQDVYDESNTKIGEVMDVLLDQSGQVNAVIVGVGGFLGAGEKDVDLDEIVALGSRRLVVEAQGLSDDGHHQRRAQERAWFQIRQRQDDLGSCQVLVQVALSFCERLGKPRPRRGFPLFSLDQRALWNLLVEILRDAFEHARIGQQHRAIGLGEHPHPP